jgi:hypothetical protein
MLLSDKVTDLVGDSDSRSSFLNFDISKIPFVYVYKGI